MLAQRIFLMSIKGFSKVRSFSNVFTCCAKPLFFLISSAKLIFETSYFYSKVTYFSFTFYNLETYSFISSSDLINSSVFKPEVPAGAVSEFVLVTISVVTKGTLDARAVPSVEGTTVDTTGIMFRG